MDRESSILIGDGVSVMGYLYILSEERLVYAMDTVGSCTKSCKMKNERKRKRYNSCSDDCKRKTKDEARSRENYCKRYWS